MEIHTIDILHRDTPHAIAVYLVVGPDGPVLIDTGTRPTLPNVEAGLRQHGFKLADIRHILVTHIHLDHSGAAGWWAQQGAQVYVHPVGAPHLIDPSRLLSSAKRVYGDEMEALWGEVLPAPEERVTVLHDDDTVEVCGLRFVALDTPGHARHHHTFMVGDVCFPGDVGGVRMPETSVVWLPAPPPEFDLEAWHTSVARLLQEDIAVLYPTHFGRVDDVREHLEALTSLISQAAEFVRDRMQAGMERDAIVEEYLAWQRTRAVAAGMDDEAVHQSNVANAHDASVDGIMRYWRKRWECESRPE